MKPLFEVGEEVILQSKTDPEYNGEATVLDIHLPMEVYNCHCCGKERVTKQISYRLDVNSTCEEIGGYIYTACFKETSLRKKPKPSGFSFNELISEIKNTELVEV